MQCASVRMLVLSDYLSDLKNTNNEDAVHITIESFKLAQKSYLIKDE